MLISSPGKRGHPHRCGHLSSFSCSAQAPQVLVSPRNGATFIQGESVPLFGVGYSPAGGSVEPEILNWSSSIDGFLGTGQQLVVHTLSGGRHCITLSADDACGGDPPDDEELKLSRVIR